MPGLCHPPCPCPSVPLSLLGSIPSGRPGNAHPAPAPKGLFFPGSNQPPAPSQQVLMPSEQDYASVPKACGTFNQVLLCLAPGETPACVFSSWGHHNARPDLPCHLRGQPGGFLLLPQGLGRSESRALRDVFSEWGFYQPHPRVCGWNLSQS